MVNNIKGIFFSLIVIGACGLFAMQKKEPLIYFKWAGAGPNESKLNVVARLQDPSTLKVLKEEVLQPNQAIMYNSSTPVNLYLKKDEFFSKLSDNWTGPYTLEPNHPQYGRHNEPNFEYIIGCDPSIMHCPISAKASLAL